MVEPEFDDDSRRILVGYNFLARRLWAEVTQASEPPASSLKFYFDNNDHFLSYLRGDETDVYHVHEWHPAFTSHARLHEIQKHWMKRFGSDEASKSVAKTQNNPKQNANISLGRPLSTLDVEPQEISLSKNRRLSGKNGLPKPHTMNPNDANDASIMQKFWKGDELSAIEKKVMGAIIARELQLSTHPAAELIDLLGKYRRNFGPKANPFNTARWLEFLENSGQVKEPEKGEDKLDTELEITLSAVKTPSFPGMLDDLSQSL